MLLSNAFAKHHKGYKNLEGGDPIESWLCLTGAPYTAKLVHDLSIQTLYEYVHTKKYGVTVASKSHIWAITNVDTKTNEVHLFEPTNVDKYVESQIHMPPNSRKMEESGMFAMSFAHFQETFHRSDHQVGTVSVGMFDEYKRVEHKLESNFDRNTCYRLTTNRPAQAGEIALCVFQTSLRPRLEGYPIWTYKDVDNFLCCGYASTSLRRRNNFMVNKKQFDLKPEQIESKPSALTVATVFYVRKNSKITLKVTSIQLAQCPLELS